MAFLTQWIDLVQYVEDAHKHNLIDLQQLAVLLYCFLGRKQKILQATSSRRLVKLVICPPGQPHSMGSVDAIPTTSRFILDSHSPQAQYIVVAVRELGEHFVMQKIFQNWWQISYTGITFCIYRQSFPTTSLSFTIR